MNLIASIYIKDNKTVNIKSGDFRTLKIYPESPIDLFNQFESVGIKEVYVVDLGSAKMHEKNNFKSSFSFVVKEYFLLSLSINKFWLCRYEYEPKLNS